MSSPFQKKFSSKSPFRQEIDPTELQYTTTNTAKTLSGEVVPTSGKAVVNIPASREVEKIAPNEQYIQSFQPEFKKAQEGGYTGTMPEYIKEKEANLGYTGKNVTVTRERDYSSEVTPDETLYPNPYKNFKYRRWQADQNKRLTAAQEGDSLTGAEILRRAKDVYGGTHDPYIASWLRKNKLSVSDKPNVRSGKSTENLSDYEYDIRTGN